MNNQKYLYKITRHYQNLFNDKIAVSKNASLSDNNSVNITRNKTSSVNNVTSSMLLIQLNFHSHQNHVNSKDPLKIKYGSKIS